MLRFFKDKKNLVILLLITLFLIKIPREAQRFAFWVISGITFCLALDFLINKLFLKKNIFPNSAIISGFIVSGILDYRQPWFILIIFSALAVISKHIIKFNRRHIFNPANLALFFATVFKIPLTWGIESNIFLIIIFGLYFAYSYKKFPHIFGFLLFFIGLAAIYRMNSFSLISWFFLFIMLIEPKTSGFGILRGFIFGVISGTLAFLMFKFLPELNPFVCSLFVANLSRPFLEKIVKV